MTFHPPLRRDDLRALTLAGLASAATAGVGSLSTLKAREEYALLRKPRWSPPGWIFGPVWITLYAMMAGAAWLTWRQEPRSEGRAALRAYAVQLGFNAAWSPLFFAFRQRGFALTDLSLMWISLVTTLVLCAQRSRIAALLLVPYLVWTTFAGALNAAVWKKNRPSISAL